MENYSEKPLNTEVSETSSPSLPAWVNTVTQRADDFDRQIQDFIRRRPVAVMLGVLALGFVAKKIIDSSESKHNSNINLREAS